MKAQRGQCWLSDCKLGRKETSWMIGFMSVSSLQGVDTDPARRKETGQSNGGNTTNCSGVIKE